MSVRSVQRLIGGVAFALLLAGTFQPFYVRILFADRSAMKPYLTELPYRKTPGLRAFLVEARERIRPGEVVVFLAPFETWEGGYRYAMRGARYILGGRTVRGVIGPYDVDLSSNLDQADVIVAWRAPVPTGWTVTWAGREGAVARREAEGE